MYEMTLDGETFFFPSNSDYAFTELSLHESLNDSGYIEAVVPYTNPMYSKIEPMRSRVSLIKDKKVVFDGLITECETDFYKQKHIYIVGKLAYLNDSVQPQANYLGYTKKQMLEALLDNHNKQSNEKFYAGIVGVNSTPKTLIDYGYTLDIIRENICEDDGYIRLRNANNKTYVDVVPIEDYGELSDQFVRFGSNLLDYTESLNGSTIVTAVLPLGARLEESKVEGLDSRLGIESVNGGNNVITNPSSLEQFGYRCRVVTFDSINDPEELMSRAKAYLTTYQYANMTLNLSAVDLSMLDSSQDDYSVGDYVRCIAEPFDMDISLPVRTKETNILDLSQNKIALGVTKAKSLTQTVATDTANITAQLPQNSWLLQSAKNNAKELINYNAQGGQVSMRIGDDGKPYEILIMDKDNIIDSTKAWRWNMGGFGYGTKAAGASEYDWNPKVAITMDGAIVADAITTGVLKSIEINNGNGTFKVDADGKMYASSGEFKGDVSAATLGGGAGNTLQTAIDTANQAIALAQSSANQAQSTADTANQAAAVAHSAATTAQSAAATANSAAQVAHQAANTAQGKANSAYELAASKVSANQISGFFTSGYDAKFSNLTLGGKSISMQTATIYTSSGYSYPIHYLCWG